MKSQKQKNLLHKHRHSSICHINSVILHFNYNSVDRMQRKHVIVLSVLMFEILSVTIHFNQNNYIVWFNGSYFFYTFHKCFVINLNLPRRFFLFSFLYLSSCLLSSVLFFFIYIVLWVPLLLFLSHAIPYLTLPSDSPFFTTKSNITQIKFYYAKNQCNIITKMLHAPNPKMFGSSWIYIELNIIIH